MLAFVCAGAHINTRQGAVNSNVKKEVSFFCLNETGGRAVYSCDHVNNCQKGS
jgi:hypothetical protein